MLKPITRRERLLSGDRSIRPITRLEQIICGYRPKKLYTHFEFVIFRGAEPRSRLEYVITGRSLPRTREEHFFKIWFERMKNNENT